LTLETPAYITWSTPRTSRRTAVLLASLRANEPDIAPVVIDAMTSSQWDPSVDTRSIREIVGNTDTFGESLHPDDAVPYALSRLLDDLASQGRGAIVLNPNVIVTAATKDLVRWISPDSVMVGATRRAEPTSRTPHLDKVQSSASRAPIRAILVGQDAGRFRSLLRAAMDEVVVDPFLRRPAQVLDWVTASAVDTGLAGSLPAHLIVGLADYRGDTEGGPVFLDAEPLWVALDQQEKGEETAGYGGTPIGTLLMELRVHDIGPLKEPLEFIESEVESSLRAPEPYRPASDLILDIRRATDPLGHRWGPGGDRDFHKWLYETNGAGLTRLAHLVWLARADLMQTFPEVRWEASRLKRWNDVRALPEFGIDFFDRSVEPTVSEGKWVPPPHAMGRSERLRNAVAWRYKLARSLIPGMGLGPRSMQSGTPKLKPPVRKQPRVAASRFGAGNESITLMGLLRSNSGLGQAARASFRALEHLNRPFSVLDTTDQYLSKNTTDPGLDRHPFGAHGELNLIHANAAEFAAPLGMFHHRLGGRFNAAMWFWEGATLPVEWMPAFDRVDELWLASNYLADVFGQYERVPVRVVGLAADLPEPTDASRSMLGLGDEDLVFLFVFDAQSVAERKNPDLALTAFERAFGRGNEGVRFIIKTHNLHKMPGSEARLRRIEASNSSVTIVNEYWGRDQLLRLMQVADVYVSPHAAEGFGLTLLESMALGTPVIATAFSGNMDFTTEANSWLIDYTLTSLPERAGPYPAGTVWAQPSLEALVETMRVIAGDRARVTEKGQIAHDDALETASLERYASRLDDLIRQVL
jgi:glycosyltransferase involved in cell wall biosynthesis